MEKARTLSDKDDPALRCLPVAFGTINISLYGLGFVGQIIQTPKFVTMLTETYHSFKIIPTDGRRHRDDVAPSYRGDSVGHWEGDTLVVDTTNFNDQARVAGQMVRNMHLVERFTKRDADTIRYQFTVDDPTTWTRPWSGEVPWPRLEGPMYEAACTEENYSLLNVLKGMKFDEDAAAKKGVTK